MQIEVGLQPHPAFSIMRLLVHLAITRPVAGCEWIMLLDNKTKDCSAVFSPMLAQQMDQVPGVVIAKRRLTWKDSGTSALQVHLLL